MAAKETTRRYPEDGQRDVGGIVLAALSENFENYSRVTTVLCELLENSVTMNYGDDWRSN